MQKYTQLTYEQRYHIYLLNKQGYNQTFIAKSMGRNKSQQLKHFYWFFYLKRPLHK
jgi:IS30 family transposase